jgi:tRNA(Ile)-lysidine synthase
VPFLFSSMTHSPSSFSLLQDRLARIAAEHPGVDIWVAYSGGLDSRVLLQLAVDSGLNKQGRLKAVHVHHGLQAQADDWARHCQSSCDSLGVALRVHRVPVGSGSGLENRARIARYQVFESLLADGDLLLQGHHADDQSETLLLRLMRGSGVRGLASIPATRALGRGRLLRPLLSYGRQQLHGYAQQHGLSWIEDPSNLDTRHDRNYLRAKVLPLLRHRWPHAVQSLGLSASNCADAQRLCQELAAIDLQACVQDDAGLAIPRLAGLSAHRRSNVLRYWLQELAGVSPDEALLQRLWTEVALAQADAQPQLELGAITLRRFEDGLYLLPESSPAAAERVWDWPVDSHCRSELQLPGGTLQAEPVAGAGLALPSSGCLQVRLRTGGERIQLPGRVGRRSLKKLLQQQRVAPWLRQQLPLLYDGERLLAVADLWIAEGHAAAPGAPGIRLSWAPRDVPLTVSAQLSQVGDF